MEYTVHEPFYISCIIMFPHSVNINQYDGLHIFFPLYSQYHDFIYKQYPTNQSSLNTTQMGDNPSSKPLLTQVLDIYLRQRTFSE